MNPVAGIAVAGVALAYLDAKHYITEDAVKILAFVKANLALRRNNRKDRNSVFYVFEEQVRKVGRGVQRECYVCEGHSVTWREVDIQARRVAHYLIKCGVKRGDVIAIFLPNKPAYPIIWIACLSLDVIPAFVNYNLTGTSLLHCINSVSTSLVLFDASLSTQIFDIIPSLLPSIKFVSWEDEYTTPAFRTVPQLDRFNECTSAVRAMMKEDRIGDEWRAGVKWLDPCVFIFTSGTTGLPKAAIIPHCKVSMAASAWPTFHSFNKHTRIYTPMPIYHSTAALLAITVSWSSGATVVIGRKFSATRFWDEVRESDANTIQYVGEVLRYLLAAPPSSKDKDHKVKMAYGNGCRPDIWNKFRERFGIKTIAEFFSASEANVALLNVNRNDLGVGAVGHEGTLIGLAARNQLAILRIDLDTEEPLRNLKGFCIRAKSNEPGELISRIVKGSPNQDFVGYHDNEAGTEKKILRNVFSAGDAWFRSGDLLVRDKEGFYYFKDRLGETFRWKGENVATTEVAEVLGAVVSEANVYGVSLPRHDGRAGCAAIPLDQGPVDLERLALHVIRTLPKYAQPLFLRLVPKLESTGTEKQVKVTLRNEGVDPSNVNTAHVFWLRDGKYVPFGVKDWESLQSGRSRL